MLEAYGASDPGCVRSNNEDYFLVVPALGLYLVADGMGGAQAGEHASRLAAETIQQAVEQNGKAMDSDGLVVAFNRANQRVMEEAARDPQMEGMGTTLVAAVENNGDLLVASVGDSRVYTFENGALQPVTEDQTWVNEVGRRLGIDEENLKNHPMRHVLTMAIGVSDNLRVHTHRIVPTPGMLILLCSDGLHGVVSEEEIKNALSSAGSLEAKSKELIATARSRGGPDNITTVLLRAALSGDEQIEDFRLDRTQLSVSHLTDPDDSVEYWLARPVEERLRALELARRTFYGYTRASEGLQRVLEVAHSNGVEYLLIGGYAVGIYGYIRATNDLDIWVKVSSENADSIYRALREFGFAAAGLTSDLFLARNNVVRIGMPPIRIEILTSISGVEFEICYIEKEMIQIEEIVVPVISLARLRENKAASGRAKDLADLENLPG